MTENSADVWRTLFNRRGFLELNTDATRIHRFEARDEQDRLIGGLTAVMDDGDLVNGYSAPFGGFDLVDPAATAEDVAATITQTVAAAAATGARRLVVKLPPASHGTLQGMVQFFLLNNGFTLHRTELNQSIDLRGVSSDDDAAALPRKVVMNRVRKLRSLGYHFTSTPTPEELRAGYAVMKANREVKGRPMPLSLDYLLEAQRELAPAIVFHTLTMEDRVVAGALTYEISRDATSIISWGDDPAWEGEPPMPALAHEVTRWAVGRGVSTLDIGTSSEPGEPGAQELNFGLARFKRGLGATAEVRLQLVRDL